MSIFSKKYIIFAFFVLFLFSGCSLSLQDCKIFPNMQDNPIDNKFQRDSIKKTLKHGGVYTQFKCNF